MNILYLCADPGIPVRGSKGAAVHVRALSDAFCSLGHRVTLFTPRAGPADGPLPLAKLVEVGAGQEPAHLSAGENHEAAALAAAQAVYAAASDWIRREPFDFIYERYSLWSDAGARLRRETGLPLVVEVNAPLRQEAARYRSLINSDLAARIENDLFEAADVISVVSQPLRAYVAERGAPSEKIHVLPNAVDEHHFHPAVDGSAVRNRLSLSDKFVVGFVGTTRPWHDLETLILAMQRLVKERASLPVLASGARGGYHMLLVGEVSDAVRRSIETNRLAEVTTIVGPLPNSEVPGFLAAMDVAVSPHPSLEGFYFSPLKLFEYLACGVATVAADVSPVAEVVDNGVDGLLYTPGDAESLAAQIDALAADLALRRKLGLHGAIRVLRDHTWKENANRIIQLCCQHISPPHSDIAPKLIPQEKPILDEKMERFLYRATRPDLVEPYLLGRLAANGKKDAMRLSRFQVIKYKPGRRCVIQYELIGGQSGDDQVFWIGKVFRDERGKNLLAIQEAFWMDGFSLQADDCITVAEPIAYIPELRMFVQERAPGVTLDQSLGKPDFGEKVRSSAAAIAKLHNSRIRLVKTYTVQDELANLEQWAAGLSVQRPALAGAFQQQLSRLQALASSLPVVDFHPAHRDFHYGQVLFSPPRVTLIDLDMLALADPVIDVANFAAHLQFLALQFLPDPHQLDGLARVFLEQYLQFRPVPDFWPRLVFYEAATFFRLMHVALNRPQFASCFDALFELTEQKTHFALENLKDA